MKELGRKIAQCRKDAGLTQIEFAENLSVTRQTVSRWEAGTVLPDIDKIPDIASLLGVSCDYLMKDDAEEESRAPVSRGMERLLQQMVGKTVRLNFFEDEMDIDLYDTPVRIVEFDGGWMRIQADTKKGQIEKLIPLASVLSMELEGEDA